MVVVEVRDEHCVDASVRRVEALGNGVRVLAAYDAGLLGKNVKIYREPVKPSAYRFMLGDNSEVGIRW